VTGAFVLIASQWPLGLKVYVQVTNVAVLWQKEEDSSAVSGMTTSWSDSHPTKIVWILGVYSTGRW